MKKKIISVAAAVLLLFALFCVPVSAASGEFTIDFFDFGLESLAFSQGAGIEYLNYSGYSSVSGGRKFDFQYSNSSGSFGYNGGFEIIMVSRLPNSYTLTNGDFIKFACKFNLSNYGVRSVSVFLGSVYSGGFVPHFEKRYDLGSYSTGGGVWPYPALTSTYTGESISVDYIKIKFLVNGDISLSDGDVFSINAYNPVVFFVGSKADAPVYPSPEGKDEIGEYQDKENEILNDSQEGLDETENIITGTEDHLISFTDGIMGASRIFEILLDFTAMPNWKSILWISLSFGVVLFLLGVVPSLVRGVKR